MATSEKFTMKSHGHADKKLLSCRRGSTASRLITRNVLVIENAGENAWYDRPSTVTEKWFCCLFASILARSFLAVPRTTNMTGFMQVSNKRANSASLPELPHVIIALGHHHGILLFSRDWLDLLCVTAPTGKRLSGMDVVFCLHSINLNDSSSPTCKQRCKEATNYA